MDSVKVFVSDNNVSTQVTPIFESDPSISFEKVNEYSSLLPNFQGKLTFKGSDFQYFLNIENNNKCDLITIIIQELCNGTWVDAWVGEFGTVDGDFDLDRCIFKIEPNISSIYANLLNGIEYNIVDVSGNYNIKHTLGSLGTGNLQTVQYTNCKKFEDVLLYLAKRSDDRVTQIISDFFQINPVNINTNNYVTGVLGLAYTGMFISPLSNIRNPIPTELSTVENISFKDFMLDLNVLFNIEWTVTGTTIRIEHASFFKTQQGFDLTQSQYIKYIVGKRKYSYNRSKSPKYEKFSQFSSDQGALIEYNNACGKNKINDNTISYTTKKIYTDYYRAYNEGDKISRSQSGVLLFSVLRGSTLVGNNLFSIWNYDLSIPVLVLRFHRHMRPNQNGLFKYLKYNPINTDEDYGNLFIYSEYPLKVQDEILIKNCCVNLFDSDKLIKTSFGWGEVEKAKYSLYKKTLTLTIAHKSNVDNTDIEPTDVSNINTWLKFNTGLVLDGSGRVQAWNAVTGINAVQATAANRPFVTSGVISLNGTNSLVMPNFPLFPSKRGTLFIVLRNNFATAPTGDNIAISTNKSTFGVHFDFSFKYTVDNTTVVQPGFPVDDYYEPFSFFENIKYPTTTKYGLYRDSPGWSGLMIFSIVRDADDKLRFFINGKPTKDHIMSVLNAQTIQGNVYLGFDGNNKYAGSLFLYELLIYDRALTSIERQKIEISLSKRLNINLYTTS
jgi:hypothetical protein